MTTERWGRLDRLSLSTALLRAIGRQGLYPEAAMPFDRKTYNREYMRQWRKSERAKLQKARQTGSPHAACDAEIFRLKDKIKKLEREIRRERGEPFNW